MNAQVRDSLCIASRRAHARPGLAVHSVALPLRYSAHMGLATQSSCVHALLPFVALAILSAP
jgi:hypothetical protein